MIEVLEETFAPFVNPEKPQVFPWIAASFIRMGMIVCTLVIEIVEACRARKKQGNMIDKKISLYILYFLAIPMP